MTTHESPAPEPNVPEPNVPEPNTPDEGEPSEAPSPTATRDGRRTALAVLETLAGEKTPTEAAESIGVSLTYFYTLENRALEGLVKGCEPKPKGRQWTVERELEEVRKENMQLRREVRRAQAVARAAQRSLELPSTVKPKARRKKAAKKGRRKKRATVRALKVLDRLKSETQEE